MKRFIFSILFVLALVIAFGSPAFALQCKTGNYGSDECWTTAKRVTDDIGQVIAGTVMVYDFTTGVNEGNDADDAAFYVRTSSSADQNYIVAGVAQKTYASSDTVQLLVRGKGLLRANAATVSGDRLYVATASGFATRGHVSPIHSVTAEHVSSDDKHIAFALENNTAAATIDAFIVVV